jgi:3'-phosphoadenosine 5'-phosphosulfate sulfotransferase (PAPS reductase)/FAD synthetase
MSKIICWWSGGITSAVACKVALDLYGKENCRVIMIDTKNEDDDTYRFKSDCEKWYSANIEVITGIGDDYKDIESVWFKHKSLNVANGAICSSKLKRAVREKWQEHNDFDFQVFGFEFDKKEFNRALSLSKNHPKAKSIYPLLMKGYTKDDCLRIVKDAGIEIPRMYSLGFRNNNCFKTGCVQGGIGYWQKMKKEFPEKFNKMADIEHELTNIKGEPVTMLKDQSNETKKNVLETDIKWKNLVFLKKHPKYPELKCLDDMKEREVKPLFECNGFCGINELTEKSETENEINYQF